MILLFGEKASKSSQTRRSSNVKNNNPVENSGILAMSFSEAKSKLTMGEFDTYQSNNPYAVNYALYSNMSFDDCSSEGFMSDISASIAMLGDCGFDCGFGGFDCGGGFSSGGDCCSSFSSVG